MSDERHDRLRSRVSSLEDENEQSAIALTAEIEENHRLRAEVERLKSQLAAPAAKERVAPVLRGDGSGGWMVCTDQIQRIAESARCLDDVSMEQAEAVLLAMVDEGMAWLGEERH